VTSSEIYRNQSQKNDNDINPFNSGFTIPNMEYAFTLKHMCELGLHDLKTPDEKESKMTDVFSDYQPVLLELVVTGQSSVFRKRQLKRNNLAEHGVKEEIFR
jgi:hypothetical protein